MSIKFEIYFIPFQVSRWWISDTQWVSPVGLPPGMSPSSYLAVCQRNSGPRPGYQSDSRHHPCGTHWLTIHSGRCYDFFLLWTIPFFLSTCTVYFHRCSLDSLICVSSSVEYLTKMFVETIFIIWCLFQFFYICCFSFWIWMDEKYIWVKSRNCGCLVTRFCYQLIAKPGNKTATVSWPDPYDTWKGIASMQIQILRFCVTYIYRYWWSW